MIPGKNIQSAGSILIGLALLFAGAWAWQGRRSALTAFLAGAIVAVINIFLLFSASQKMFRVPAGKVTAYFFRAFMLRLLLLIALFGVCLVVLKLPVLAFFIGNILCFYVLLFLVSGNTCSWC